MGITTADAPRPLLGTLEKATPKAVEPPIPRNMIKANMSHLCNEDGIWIPKNRTPPRRRKAT